MLTNHSQTDQAVFTVGFKSFYLKNKYFFKYFNFIIMAKPPPDPLFVFHEGMESVFCLLFVINDNNELIYAGTGDGKVYIWDLEDNRKLKTNKIGDNTCLQLHHIDQQLFVTQEKSGPSTVWQEDTTTMDWSKKHVIPSSYVGFCRSVLTQDMRLIIPCGGSVLKLVCLLEDKKKGGIVDEKGNSGENSVVKMGNNGASCCKSGDTKGNTILSELGDSLKTIISELVGKTFIEKYLCCKNDEKTGEVMALKSFGQFLLAVYESGELKLWCLGTQKCLGTLKLFDVTVDGGSDCPMAIDFDEATGCGIVGSSSAELIEFSLEGFGVNCEQTKNSTVVAYDEPVKNSTVTAEVKLVKTRTVTMTNPGSSCVKIREDGKLFLVGSWDGRIRVYSCRSLKLLVVLDSHRKKTVQDLVFSSKENMKSWTGNNVFATGGLDGRVCLWSIY
ncbi:guanine nucleotide-binding protein subunit beta-like protein 1 [Nilaparvata lugens]|uniref:guanine nucleotide-binding protein subunit beta-like protein 1 n=1 Tax=Nilaparvata lugens TaxID=108931 RepID=UPI00193EAE48|nr:guanine nucleotide-binding protein subunit beta-like protein 1 [Nilaparvata lugens]